MEVFGDMKFSIVWKHGQGIFIKGARKAKKMN